jgi:antitoxin ParD1/3/4
MVQFQGVTSTPKVHRGTTKGNAMNVSLTEQMVEFVQRQVASGQYQSASEVIRAGVRLLQQQKQDREARLDRLRKEVALGIEEADRGELAPLDIEQVKAEGRCRLAEKQRRGRRETPNG